MQEACVDKTSSASHRAWAAAYTRSRCSFGLARYGWFNMSTLLLASAAVWGGGGCVEGGGEVKG